MALALCCCSAHGGSARAPDVQSEKAIKNLKGTLDVRQCTVGPSDVPEKNFVFQVNAANGARSSPQRWRAPAHPRSRRGPRSCVPPREPGAEVLFQAADMADQVRWVEAINIERQQKKATGVCSAGARARATCAVAE